MRTAFTLLGALLTLSSVGCYNPALPDEPFLCDLPRGKGTCPDGYDCFGGICGKSIPDCLSWADPMYINWPNDNDFEPNNHPGLAVELPCGGNPNDPSYAALCPNRENAVNGFANLLICPIGDVDFYKIYLLPEETVDFTIYYRYDTVLPRDIDAKVWRWDLLNLKYVEVSVNGGLSTTDNEDFTISTAVATGNPEGWYYIEVFGKGTADPAKGNVNFYSINFKLNPTH
jgi:hypothetical protein